MKILYPISHKLAIKEPEVWGWRDVKTPVLSPLISWDGMAWGNGRYVAVSLSQNAHTMTSPDGLTWTTHGNAPSLRGIAFGNGIFVGTGWDANSTPPNDIDFSGVSGDSIWTSIDGASWVRHTIPAIPSQFNPWSIRWSAPVFGNGVFVIVSMGHQFSSLHPPQTMAAFSTNGTNWTLTPIPQQGSSLGFTHPTIPPAGLRNWTTPEFVNGEFVVTTTSFTSTSAEGGFNLRRTIFGTSSDGITWEEHALTERVNSGQQPTSAFIGHQWSFMFAKGIYVGIRGWGIHSKIATSSNLMSGWVVQDVSHLMASISLSTFGSSRYATSGDFFVIMGGPGMNSQSIGSHNGHDWFQINIPSPTSRTWGATMYHDNAFLSVSSNFHLGTAPAQVIRLSDWQSRD